MPKPPVDHESRILRIVKRHGPLLISAIAEITGRHHAEASRTVKKLVDAKVLTRRTGIGHAHLIAFPDQT